MMAVWSWEIDANRVRDRSTNQRRGGVEPLRTGSREWDEAIDRLQALAA